MSSFGKEGEAAGKTSAGSFPAAVVARSLKIGVSLMAWDPICWAWDPSLRSG